MAVGTDFGAVHSGLHKNRCCGLFVSTLFTGHVSVDAKLGGVLLYILKCVSKSLSDSLCVIGSGCVVALEQRLHEESQRSHHTHQDEDPQEQTVYHHGHILPVLNDLKPDNDVQT